MITGHEGAEGAQLYDMERDPSERKNVAPDPAHASTLAELKKAIADYRAGPPKP